MLITILTRQQKGYKMTDKQIIIDGVDVSKCGHYHYGKCEIDYDEWNNEIIRYNECQNNPNCYFKQLKRKEQECEKLYIQLKADEEYHKEEENTLRKIIKNKEERNIELYNENNKLKQTLTEIIRFFKEDEKFARYSGRPIIFAKPTLEKIEKILKENDIKIS